ncbi:MAG: helix-turn-helix transcriptional regulator [Bacteroidetes bacterium]|nr:helix-turn-helix transcriptional regulator [Bacteroidota bacterium]
MTARKERILKSSLELFTENGFHGTSTYGISQHAEVSEGLIFRHFRNKEGLGKAMVEYANEQLSMLYEPILREVDAVIVVRKSLEFPFNLPQALLPYLKLRTKLEWELNLENTDHFAPLRNALINAFTTLGYYQPVQEARVVEMLIEGTLAEVLKDKLADADVLLAYFKTKYAL